MYLNEDTNVRYPTEYLDCRKMKQSADLLSTITSENSSILLVSHPARPNDIAEADAELSNREVIDMDSSINDAIETTCEKNRKFENVNIKNKTISSRKK